MNKNLSIPIIKNVAAFMNTAGGTLLVGINDDGKVLGLDADYAVMKKPNTDGFELIFNNAFYPNDRGRVPPLRAALFPRD